MNNPGAIILMIWGLCTIALILDLALRFGRENDLQKKQPELEYWEEKDKTKFY